MITTLLAAVTVNSALQANTLDADFDVALGTIGLSTRTARFDPNLLPFFRQGEFTTVLYDACHENPWRIPFFGETLYKELSLAAAKPQDALSAGMRMMGVQTRRALIGNPNLAIDESSKKPGALAALLNQWKATGAVTGPIPSLADVPESVQSAATLMLGAIQKAVDARKLALSEIVDLPGAFNRLTVADADTDMSPGFQQRLAIYRKVDLSYFAAGAFDLFTASQEANSRIATVPPGEKYAVKIPTKWGDVILSGGTNDRYDQSAALIIDTGGNDVYINLPATRTVNAPVSVVLDGDGADQYLSDARLANTPLDQWAPRSNGGPAVGPGGALFGMTVLWDRSGDDVYRTHAPGLGSARVGFSALVDNAGADVYDAYADGAGFATFGFGMIDDLAGNDRYYGFNQVQGCGQTRGFGFLADRAGDDTYVANDAVIDFPSPQSAQHNVSMAQGAGNGRRADYLDGHSLAGGIGLLIDQSGSDTYTCGVFGQGVGYWEGVGMLVDVEGKDKYYGQWYTQGASAHFAIGYLDDGAGNDTYLSPMNMAIGAGHDFGTGFLIDRGGDDSYTAPNLSLGAGNANGIGVFVDLFGTDTYVSSGITLGSAAESTKNSLRTRALTLGVFMDLSGDDTFPPAAPWAKNASRVPNLKERGPTPAESQLGVFWDR